MAALDEFIASFSKFGGHALANRFEVKITSPPAIRDPDADRHVSFRVEAFTMPGKNIRTVTNETVYGPTYEMAQGLTYAEDISMTFFLSAEHFERQYFLKWQDLVVKPNNYNLEYYNQYVTPIEVFQLGKNGLPLAGLRLNECFPKTVGAIEYSAQNVDIARQEVSFVFKDFVFIDADGKEMDNSDTRKFATTNPPITKAGPKPTNTNIPYR
tara:strand:- start:3640 stop:4275 length:636 start_codon:yes stop_codon:yes gene_type:complete